MKQSFAVSLVVALVAALFSTLVIAGAGCKQGAGERCQVLDDCTPPLICNMATQTCDDMAAGGIDVLVPDAPTDAPPDQ